MQVCLILSDFSCLISVLDNFPYTRTRSQKKDRVDQILQDLNVFLFSPIFLFYSPLSI